MWHDPSVGYTKDGTPTEPWRDWVWLGHLTSWKQEPTPSRFCLQRISDQFKMTNEVAVWKFPRSHFLSLARAKCKSAHNPELGTIANEYQMANYLMRYYEGLDE